jgi:hypothetical protein
MKVVMRGDPAQMRRQLACGLPPELRYRFRTERGALRGVLAHFRALALDPRALLLGKQFGMTAGPPLWNGDAHGSVRPDANNISPRPRMSDEFHERITIVLGTDSE